jgi:hypothetical protein
MCFNKFIASVALGQTLHVAVYQLVQFVTWVPHLAACSFELLEGILVLIHHVIILFEHLLYLLLILSVFVAIVAFARIGLLHH